MRRPIVVVVWFVMTAGFAAGCGDDAAAVPFEIEISPEIVQGAIPGQPTGVLVTVIDESADGDPVALTATAGGAEVTVEPAEIRAGEVAEVTVVAASVAEETPLQIQVVGRRNGLEASATRETRVMPFDEAPESEAVALLAVFTAWLAEQRPDLGIGTATEFAGSFVCPLLVVTHYLFLSEEWEIGLSWHVMIPPDDWAEIYLRPRDAVAPAMAFRLESRAAAFTDGVVTITEVEPPPEVVR